MGGAAVGMAAVNLLGGQALQTAYALTARIAVCGAVTHRLKRTTGLHGKW